MSIMESHQLRLWADFTDLEDDEIETTLRAAGFIPDGEPRVGQWVELWDHDGNLCFAKVIEVRPPVVRLKVDFNTWRDAPALTPPLHERQSVAPLIGSASQSFS